jgi:hypothetical protein
VPCNKWDRLLADVIVSGIFEKIKNGEPLTPEQQAVKDAIPKKFPWPQQGSYAAP